MGKKASADKANQVSGEHGSARSPGITYQQLLDQDTHPVPDVLRLESPRYLGTEDLPVARYTTRAFHELEKNRLWSRVWQYACREEEIPETGDYYLYEIVGLSYIVIRTSDGQIKAYPNACLHRGRRLKDYDGRCSELRCPFHGFAWTLEGKLDHIPADWDFSHIDREKFGLPEVQVGTWAGFVFVNPDPDAAPFSEFISEMAEQFEVWDLGNRYKQGHVAKVISANWKVVQEAFCEAYHVNATHPQILRNLGDTNSQVDIWENCARVITPGGTPSPLLGYAVSEDEMMSSMMDVRHDQEPPSPLPEGVTARAAGAAGARTQWEKVVGPEWASRLSDAELMDSIDYTLFPNFHPWGAFNRIVYRFRPNGDDHRSAIMECILLAPFQGERPPPAKIHWLTDDEVFSDAKELGMLGKVFDQDLFNMPNVQLGLETTQKPGITLANYQESKLRWLHQKLGEWVGDGTEGEAGE
jgi:phenylpropionate dioxygenase-like ring-hydroxylating dioxygenase large terminal subunit